MTSTEDQGAPDPAAVTARPAAPVAAGNRHESLDVLRGFAVLGILMVNVQAFMMYYGAYPYPPAHMDLSGANGQAWLTTFVFFEAKFITLFSTMFGAGIMLMVGDKPDASRKLHFSRMRWLLAIGLIHGFVFWFGDILAVYAVIGFLAVLFRKMSMVKLVAWGLAFIVLGSVLAFANFWSMSALPASLEPAPFNVVPDADTMAMFTQAYQGGFLESRIINAITYAVGLLGQLVGYSPRLLGLMLIGMALYKSGFLQARWSAPVYAVLALVCLAPSLPVLWILGETALSDGFPAGPLWRHTGANVALSLVVAFGYASLVMLLCKAPWLKLARLPFAAAGRMAFTNYLTQTFVMVALATGVAGAPLWGETERAQQVQLVIVVWIVQLIVSPIWLAVFRFGPFEWLWRSLSYGKVQPIVKSKPAKSGAD